MSFRLVPNLILNDLGRRNSPRVCVISPNSVAFGAHPQETHQEMSERELSLRRHRTRRLNTTYNRLVHKFRHKSTRYVLEVGTHVYQIQYNNAM